MRAWCRENRHASIAAQREALGHKLRGHYGYFGMTGNYDALARFEHEVRRIWHKWLCRRSQKPNMPWTRFTQLLAHHPLPKPRVVHSVLYRT